MKTWLLLGLAASLCGCGSRQQTNRLPQPQQGVVNANGIILAPNQEAILLTAGTNRKLTAWPTSFCHSLARRGYLVIGFDNRDAGLSSRGKT
ncbi:hypothetical protein DNI29_21685 [Hymenobacter sediminis]|uniref:hypothetical protein n=1 Tax=Hymenobacter sediminis TaxID=2218621 RepID=UPI000F4F4F7A|nr:hypothetical protein [Hymenobacter sediminis]RPD44321.1 hypothetical protein DNI29_21685 [Hymenobacter sediminis]